MTASTANTVRKPVSDLTKGLRDMKFMKRRKILSRAEIIKEQIEISEQKQQQTETLAVRNDEFWELKLPDNLQKILDQKLENAKLETDDFSENAAAATSSHSSRLNTKNGYYRGQKINTCQIKNCCDLLHARQSYGGFNPEIESFNNPNLKKEEEPEGTGVEDMDADLSENEMADSSFFSKKTKRQYGQAFASRGYQQLLEADQEEAKSKKSAESAKKSKMTPKPHKFATRNGPTDAYEREEGEIPDDSEVEYTMVKKSKKGFKKPRQ